MPGLTMVYLYVIDSSAFLCQASLLHRFTEQLIFRFGRPRHKQLAFRFIPCEMDGLTECTVSPYYTSANYHYLCFVSNS